MNKIKNEATDDNDDMVGDSHSNIIKNEGSNIKVEIKHEPELIIESEFLNKIKNEATDDNDDMVGDSHSNIIKNEGSNIKVEIKHEPELIIESEFSWLPTNQKQQQQEYQYHHNDGESDGEEILSTIKPILMEYEKCINKYFEGNEDCAPMPVKYEEFSIEYIDENEVGSDDVDIERDVDSENYNVDKNSNSCMELTENLDLYQDKEISEDMGDNVASGSTETFCQSSFLKWLTSNYIRYGCPICDETFNGYNSLKPHINHQHKDILNDTKFSNYYIDKAGQAICKECNTYLTKDFSLVVHSLRHSQHDTIQLRVCNICQFKSTTTSSIQNHIMEQHPDKKDLFKILNITSEKGTYRCPSCPAIYHNYNQVRFHFIDKHPKEYADLYSYSCHLCPKDAEIFGNIEEFFKHLLEKHNLQNWTLLNFDKFTKNTEEQYFVCAKCFKIFTDMDLNKFLRHYLEHDHYQRSCKTCHKKISLSFQNVYHMCEGQFKNLRNRAVKTNALCSLQEFEQHMNHLCSFCNKEFENSRNWQIHLRQTHQLDTLKGLEMKNLGKDSNKLQCNICNTFVMNSSVQLHTHRFQHLPYKPYKCRQCSEKFNSYIKALEHILKKCHDNKYEIKTIQECYKMVCPLCKSPKFTNKETLLKHYIQKHDNFLDYYTRQLDKTLICNVCQLQVAEDLNLCRTHVLSHFDQKPYECLKCSQSFHCRNACLVHVKYHFAKPTTQQQKSKDDLPTNANDQKLNDDAKHAPIILEKCKTLNEFIEYINYACPECNESLATHQLWQEHINEKHNFFQEDNVSVKNPLDDSFKCIHCQIKLDKRVEKRQKHKLIHMPYKSFICNICYHRCNSLCALYTHLRTTHFTKGSHKCPICPDISSTPDERKEHLKNIHQPSEWPDTLCTVCFRTIHLTKMKDHMLTHDINNTKIGKTNKISEKQNINDISTSVANPNEEILSTIKPILMEYEKCIIKYFEGNEDCAPMPVKYEEFSIEYIDENEVGSDDVDIERDVDGENYNVDKNSNSCMELTENLDLYQDKEISEGMDDNVASGSTKTFCQSSFLKWLTSNYIHYGCPICDETFNSYNSLKPHINHQHKDILHDTKFSNYYIDKTGQAICKECNKYLTKDFSLVVHSLRHLQQDNIKLSVCNICQFKSSTTSSIKNHIMEQHPDKKDIFKSLNIKSETKTYWCPSCPAIYHNYNQVRFHFIDKHPKEYADLYSYSCHLCPKDAEIFGNIEEFFKHLLEKHNLQNWKLLNFDKFTKNTEEQYFVCAKCFKIFTDMNLIKFLRHYLEHDNYQMSCKTCHKKISLSFQNVYHMCEGQFKNLRNRAVKTNALCSLQEFEQHMNHLCSFCNKEFETFQNWQIHLRQTHQLDTLKSLEMKNLGKDSNKLQCNICNTFVMNSSVQLHTHRFQHLPYKPYKCRQCSEKFNSYIKALEHILKKCQDNKYEIKTIQECYEMVCPLCKSPKFTNKETLLKHYIQKHDNFLDYYTRQLDKTLICNVCQLQVAEDLNLCRTHVLSHFDQKPYECLKCSQSFHGRNACLVHVKYHFAKPTTQQQKSKDNLPTNANDQKLNDDAKHAPIILEKCKTLNEFIEFINYACPECNESLATHQLWQEHINEKHNFFQEDNVSVKDPLDGSFKCIHCQIKLDKRVEKRQKHKLIHMPYKSFICNICYHRCNSLSALYTHLRSTHFTKGSHKCPICPDISSTPDERKEHLKNIHKPSEWPDTLCTVCFRTIHLTKMKDHMLTHDINNTKIGKTNKISEKQNINDISTSVANSNEEQLSKGKRKLKLKTVITKKKFKS